MLLVPSWASAGQRAADAQRRVAQGARRRDAALHDGGGGVLWPDHVRGVVHGDPRGQLAVALHRLDHRPRPRRRARLGGDDHVRLDLRVVPWLWKRDAHVFGEAGRSALLARLVGTVVYVFAMWNSGIIQGLMWRTYNESGTLAYSFVDSLVAMHPYYIARAVRRPAVPDRRRGRLLQHLDDDPRRAASRANRDRSRLCPARAASAGGVRRMFGLPLPAGTQGDRLRAGHHRRRQHRRPRRDRAAVHHRPDRRRRARHARLHAARTGRAATSTSARAATPATRR